MAPAKTAPMPYCLAVGVTQGSIAYRQNDCLNTLNSRRNSEK